MCNVLEVSADNLSITYPALIENTVPDKIPYIFLLDILKNFMAMGKPICYLPKIIERTESLLYANPALSSEDIAVKIAEEIQITSTGNTL